MTGAVLVMSTTSYVEREDWVLCQYWSVFDLENIRCQDACCEHAACCEHTACCTKQEADEIAAKGNISPGQIAMIFVIPLVAVILLFAFVLFVRRRRIKRIRKALEAELLRKIIAEALANARVNARINDLAAERRARESRGPQSPEDTMLDPPYDGSLAESGLPTRREDPSDITQSHCYRNPLDDFDKRIDNLY
ncbi:uncharacterized protein LOC128228643 isoform X1 [Mya arenaria]|uniref:uncharacterized protein LOC128228643 isoform X1 n=1 Tax=Mya arenaria TaxID=6604 RepID=UPI0022DECF08|nr:uncharacterized protein LOC128228643 isoform X1 [Mya arenaria]